ncbi:AraC family transcriptional regulator [Paenibacillus sp. D2_2]|uniref:helix-turn-helix transcriptional regulator n=1 Tax=Paenibacillus sp. D2_2 TaxID=3073092 RepID=UPI0028160DCC|nr:AraC family transcriptional regulator [Paenibacillus sp. D2_2]WMT42127.1 AraC family transcriptional regulator [Paenibacillus sp. D2_2]
MIIGIALICRAAIEGGLNEEAALTLNDYYIQQLEEEEQISGINTVIEEAVSEFTHRVANLNEQRYSAPIQACQHYISDHLYEDITLEQLAGLSFLSPNYLSSMFKKKVGVSISEYIQRERIHEAMKLLTLTQYPISDICSWLNFHDQSYFIKVFKKFTGMTPRQYRNAEQRPDGFGNDIETD